MTFAEMVSEPGLALLILSIAAGAWAGASAALAVLVKRAICEAFSDALNGVAEEIR